MGEREDGPAGTGGGSRSGVEGLLFAPWGYLLAAAFAAFHAALLTVFWGSQRMRVWSYARDDGGPQPSAAPARPSDTAEQRSAIVSAADRP